MRVARMHRQVVEALHRLQKEGRTGVFRTSAAEVSRELFFEKGAIVGAHSSSVDERLGELMVRRGRISKAELAKASKLVRAGRRLGDVLVELELVQRGEVEAFVRAQFAEIASKLVLEPPKKLEFRNIPKVGKLTDQPVPVADAIIEAARKQRTDRGEVEKLVARDPVPTLAPAAEAILMSVTLNSQEAFVLSRCDGSSSVRDIFATSPLSEDETARILFALEQAGIVMLKPTRSAP